MRITKQVVEWSGCGTGLCGAALLAANVPTSGWGFVLFLISNICMLVYAYLAKANGLMVMQIGFSVTSIAGIVNWLAH